MNFDVFSMNFDDPQAVSQLQGLRLMAVKAKTPPGLSEGHPRRTVRRAAGPRKRIM